jgi:amino acid adenylation domain-containing protein
MASVRRPAAMAPSFTRFDPAALDQSIPDRFERQVRQRPARLAVQSHTHTWSYETLNLAANRVARALVDARGTEAEPVALLIAQGAPLVAAILGVLKAGKFYAPLEAADPEARLVDVVRDTQARVVVTDARSKDIATAVAAPGSLVLDVDRLEAAPIPNVDLPIAPEARAYVYYTSGSTGRPKGVVDLHRNVLHNVMRYTNSLEITPEDRLTLLQGPSFSGAVSSLFGALLNGAAVFPFDVAREGAAAIAPWLRERGITIYHSVPALFRRVATSGVALPALRLIRLEGDRASVRDLELYRERFASHARLVNGLGATECGLVRQFFVDARTRMPDGVVPVGYPVEDMDVRVVAADGRPCGAGEVGEITVSSRYLAAGYWGRDDATAAAFSRDPVDAGRRVYRTGDLGRTQPDGCLEHLGRIDAAAKIRGHRVAVADVERALLELDGVEQAAVAPVDRRGEPGLVAYIVPSAHPAPTVSALRRGLAARLPAHAIPEAYVLLDALPLTPNGKLDRRALPAPPGHRPSLDVPLVAPRSLLEVQLTDLWAQLLHVRPIGVLDDFFDLGGDSLLWVEMLQQAETLLGRAIPLPVVLESPTIRRLADEMQREPGFAGPALVAVQPAGNRTPLFFLHGDYLSGGSYCQNLARRLGPEQPFVALTPCGLDGSPTPASYEAMATRHLEDILRARPSGPYRLGGLCNGGLVALEIARLLTAAGRDVDRLLVVAAFPIGVGFTWLRRIVGGACALAGGGPERGSDLFAGLREGILQLRAAPPAGRVAVIRQGLRRGANRVPWLRGRRGGATASGADAPSERLRRRLRTDYLQIDAAYMPRAYPGPVTLLWPAEDPIPAAAAAAWWRNVAARVDVHVVPGTHITCLTLEASASAAIITRCLDGTAGP